MVKIPYSWEIPCSLSERSVDPDLSGLQGSSNPVKPDWRIRTLAVVSALVLLSSCAPSIISRPGPPLKRAQINTVLTTLEIQKNAVSTLFSSGNISLSGHHRGLDARILIAATQDPVRIKIEITHPWGRPLAHVLINDAGLRLLSFPEKRLYLGQLGDPGLSRHLGISLDPEILWSIIRAYPVLPPYHWTISPKAHQIILLAEDLKEKTVIHMGPENRHPESLVFPRQKIQVTFSDFEYQGKLVYARKVRAEGGDENELGLDLETMVFNETLAPGVFKLDIPADFAIQPLSEPREGP